MTGSPVKRNRTKMAASTLWKYLTIILLVVSSIALLIALIVVTTNQTVKEDATTADPATQECKSRLSQTPDSEPGLFDDLNTDEIIAVRDYLLAVESLHLTPLNEATVSSNHIASIQFYPPSKKDALGYLDDNQSKPDREAIVVIFKGAAKPPVVEEYIVGPTSKPVKHRERRVPGRDYPIAFNARPYTPIEEKTLDILLIRNLTATAYRLLKESYDGYTYHNCTDRCLVLQFSAPMGYTHNTRENWYGFWRKQVSFFCHPINFEVYVNHAGADPSKWYVENVFYNDQIFGSVEELMKAYDDGTLKQIKLPAPAGTEKLFSTYERRGQAQPPKLTRGPEFYEPDGKRYTIRSRHIEYMNWAFDFRVDTSTGFQVYDARFNGTRVIYELSLQEAIATYTGYSPTQSSNNFVDSNWDMGANSHDLVQGVDCPGTASYFNLVHMINTAGPYTVKNAVCLFELNTGIPLRRHYDNNFSGGYVFYGGMANQALVLRTIATVGNYDYVHDVIFYQNGVIEVKVSASGYAFGTFYTSNVEPYGYPIHTTHLTSTTHDHLLNYKVDLDIDGTANSYETIEIGIENVTNKWLPNKKRYLIQKVLKRSTKTTEQEAVYKFNFDRPKYLNFFNEGSKNKMGINKGYRIQHSGIMKQLYPEDWVMVPMISWSLYQLAVTKQKDSERKSTSMYNQNAPANPHVDFRNFIKDNENIVNKDLVAWVTTGMMHVPHSEDIPNTATVGNSAGFFIKPFNYFDEDPSIGSTNAVLIKPTYKDLSRNTINRFGTPTGPVCLPRNYSINFDGRYG